LLFFLTAVIPSLVSAAAARLLISQEDKDVLED